MVYLVLIIGLVIGSFLNVCIYRIPQKESIVFPPSHCSSCRKRLKPADLIPLISYLALRGRCRYCGSKISFRYPLVEALNALLYALLFLHYGLTLDFALYSMLASLLIVIAFIDLDTQEIPDGLVIAGFAGGLAFMAASGFGVQLISSLLGLLIGGGLFLLIAVVSGGAMGGGDIRLMAFLGLWFGWKIILSVSMLAFIIGAIASLVLIAAKIRSRKDYIPFGPFIAIAAVINILWSSGLINWYIRLVIHR